MSTHASDLVTVVGAGISGIACARALQERGIPVRVLERGHTPGGRMASRTVDGRAVDTGASYVVAPDDTPLGAVMADWVTRGLARPWTATFGVADDDGIRSTTAGPMRYAATRGLRSLVADLAEGLDVVSERTISGVGAGRIDDEAAGPVVLAMPDPQASRLLRDGHPMRERLAEVEWEPVIAVVLTWEARRWSDDVQGVFVNDSPAVGFIADDGDRRGDAAPVLVAHTTPVLAREHLDDPAAVVPEVEAAVRRILRIDEPAADAFAHRWTFARPVRGRDDPFALVDGVGVCGDAWGGRPSVRTAWASGDALGRTIVRP